MDLRDQPCSMCGKPRGEKARGSVCLRCWITRVVRSVNREAAEQMERDLLTPEVEQPPLFEWEGLCL